MIRDGENILSGAFFYHDTDGFSTVEPCAAISVGIVDGRALLDLPYVEDVAAEVDMNVVMTGSGKFIEVQGTAEGEAFSRDDLDAMLALAEKGIDELAAMQQATVAQPPAARPAER